MRRPWHGGMFHLDLSSCCDFVSPPNPVSLAQVALLSRFTMDGAEVAQRADTLALVWRACEGSEAFTSTACCRQSKLKSLPQTFQAHK
eukprot:SAG31_NODE_685_length_12832_cov_28.355376_13_plen_88_part_00